MESLLLALTFGLGLLAFTQVVRAPAPRLVGAILLLATWLTGLGWRLPPFDARDVELGVVAGWNVVYFPGDAPWADVVLLGGEALAVLAAPLWLAGYAMRRFLRLHRAWESILAIPVLLGVVSATLAAGAISSRHSGEWRELRALLARYRDIVAREVPDRSRLLT